MTRAEATSCKKNVRITLLVLLTGFLVLIISGVYLLRTGVELDELSFSGVKLSHTRVIWQEKLSIDIEILEVASPSKEKNHPQKSIPLKQFLWSLRVFPALVSTIHIKELNLADFKASLSIKREKSDSNASYMCELFSGKDAVYGALNFTKEQLRLDITEAHYKKFGFEGKGLIEVNLGQQKQLFQGEIFADVASSFPVKLTFKGDEEKALLTLVETGPIYSITPFVDLFGLSDNIQRWITTYLQGDRYYLKKVQAEFIYDNPLSLFTSLRAEAHVENCAYTFSQGLEPVQSPLTKVFFENGTLFITPEEPLFYNQSVGDSWVEIDFNIFSDIILSVFIKTKAIANDDILHLLQQYNIPLPFKQLQGQTDTDLTIKVNLNKILVETKGSLDFEESIVKYNKKEYDVTKGRVVLENSNIYLEDLEVGLQGLFKATITGKLYLKEKRGDLAIKLQEFHTFGNANTTPELHLDPASGDLVAVYRVRPEGHFLEVESSSWLVNDSKVQIGSFSAPVDLEKIEAELDAVLVKSSPLGQLLVSGTVSLKEKIVALSCILQEYNHAGLQLETKQIPFEVDYRDGLVIRTKKSSKWLFNSTPVQLSPLSVSYHQGKFGLLPLRIRYGKLVDTNLRGRYSTQSKEGTFFLQNFIVSNRVVDEKLGFDEGLTVRLQGDFTDFSAEISELDVKVARDNKNNWLLSINDLGAIYPRSKILQKYRVSDGNVEISLAKGQEPFNFTAELSSDYQILQNDQGPVKRIVLRGEAGSSGFFATVNDVLGIRYENNHLGVVSKGLGYSVPAIISLLKDHKRTNGEVADDTEKQGVTFSLDAEDSHFVLSKRSRILADKCNLSFSQGAANIDLQHGMGAIELNVEGDHFTLAGSDLGDSFMTDLIGGAVFHGGEMAVVGQGSFDEFSAIFEVEDSVMRHLKTLNNIMAFVNTVPALVTFSLPEYSSRGLAVHSAIAGIHYKDERAVFESLEVDTAQMQGIGGGWLDFSNNMIDLDLKLITEAKSNVGKIPLLGYVLVGEKEKSSVTLKVTGPLQDPRVAHSLAKDIVKMPFEILVRALKLPFRLVGSVIKPSGKNEVTDEK